MSTYAGRRRGFLWRRRAAARDGDGEPGTATVVAVGALNMVASILMLIVSLVCLVIVIGIALVVLKANPANGLVSAVHDAAKFLVGPFDNVFKLKDPKLNVGVNWGLAAVVYFIVGRLIAGLLRR